MSRRIMVHVIYYEPARHTRMFDNVLVLILTHVYGIYTSTHTIFSAQSARELRDCGGWFDLSIALTLAREGS